MDKKNLTTLQKRAIASARAKTRVVKKHKPEYEKYYREECAKFGLSNRRTREQRIAELMKVIHSLQDQEDMESEE
jgi:hypothetical protein